MHTVDAKVADAIAAFVRAADAKSGFAELETIDRELHDEMCVTYEALISLGSQGKDAFHSLLDNDSAYVRCWLAAELLSGGDLAAKPVLEQLALNDGLVGLAARECLKQYENGNLHSPLRSRAA